MSDDARPLWSAPEVPDIAPQPARRPDRPAHEDRPPLRFWWAGFAAFLLALAVTAFGTAIVLAVVDVRQGADPPPAATIASTYVQDVAFFVAAFVFARLSSSAPALVALGLVRPRQPKRAVGIVLLCWAGFLLVGGIYALLLGIDDPSEQTVDNLGLRQSTVNLVVAGLLVAVIAPIVEEVLFRGLLFGALWRRFGFWIGAVASGIAFGGIHYGGAVTEALPVLMGLGFLLALVYKLTGSLVPAIFFHAINNGIALAGIVDWPLADRALLVVGTVTLTTLIAWLIARPVRSVLPAP